MNGRDDKFERRDALLTWIAAFITGMAAGFLLLWLLGVVAP